MIPPKGPYEIIDNRKIAELTATLRRRTGAEIRFDAGSRALYASDLSMYRQVQSASLCRDRSTM